MGIIIIPSVSAVVVAYLAYRTIGRERPLEAVLAVVIGFVFGATATYFIMSAVGNSLLASSADTIREVEVIEVGAVTSRMNVTTEYDARTDSDGTLTLEPSATSTPNYTYVNAETGNIEEVPARRTVIMVNETYDDVLLIISERFEEGTVMELIFGPNETVRERAFQLSEPPKGNTN